MIGSNIFNKLKKPASASDELAAIGLDSIFREPCASVAYRNASGFTEESIGNMRKYIILYPEILETFYAGIDSDSHLNEILSTANESGIDLYSIPFWKKKVDSLTDLENIKVSIREVWADQKDHVLAAARMVPGFDWISLVNQLTLLQRSANYIRRSYLASLGGLGETNPDALRDYIRGQVFLSGSKDARPVYAVRASLYATYVESGFLTKKTARKIRSDGSEDASLAGLKALIKHSDLYSNSDELLLQFSDSRYEQVVAHLADSLPEYLLTSIMGTQFYWAKRRLESRFERIEKAKEKAKEEAEEQERSGIFLGSTEEVLNV